MELVWDLCAQVPGAIKSRQVVLQSAEAATPDTEGKPVMITGKKRQPLHRCEIKPLQRICRNSFKVFCTFISWWIKCLKKSGGSSDGEFWLQKSNHYPSRRHAPIAWNRQPPLPSVRRNGDHARRYLRPVCDRGRQGSGMPKIRMHLSSEKKYVN